MQSAEGGFAGGVVVVDDALSSAAFVVAVVVVGVVVVVVGGGGGEEQWRDGAANIRALARRRLLPLGTVAPSYTHYCIGSPAAA